jgi:hypothetical protein
MKKKLTLELEALAVDSFETSHGAGGNGTVHAHDDVSTECQPTPPDYEPDCTCADSCLCPTNAYYCATVQETVISCDYTFNGSCLVGTGLTSVTCGGISCNRCTD